MLSEPVVRGSDRGRLGVAGGSMAFTVSGGGDHFSLMEESDEAMDHSDDENCTPESVDGEAERLVSVHSR